MANAELNAWIIEHWGILLFIGVTTLIAVQVWAGPSLYKIEELLERIALALERRQDG